MRLNTTSGDVTVAGRLAGTGPFGVETVSGDVELAPATAVLVEMTTMSGDLSSELDGRIEGSRGHRSIAIGSGGVLVTVRTMSGRRERGPPRRGPRSNAGRRGAARPAGRHPSPSPRPLRPLAPEASPPLHGTARSPRPTRTPASASSARSSGARSTSPRRAAGSRRSTAASRSRRSRRPTVPIDPASATTRVPVVEPDDA